ncbi:nitrogen regulation protein NR(II) [Streptomyces cinereoruber]|uniref:hypothetical protein n=1 Tax=Streptomyces cinereoruber TaxID=67260 RepID=UPI0036349218
MQFDPYVIGALITAAFAYFGLRYRFNGTSIRQEIKELRSNNAMLQKEIDNLKLLLSPNPTPCIWLNQEEEVTYANGAAVARIFSRLGKSAAEIQGKPIAQALGVRDFNLARTALNAPSQIAKEEGFIIGGKIPADIAVVYVVYSQQGDDVMYQLQFIL